MTSYRTTMREALETMNEDNLEKMRKAAGGAKQTLKMKDGSIGMDSFSASAIMQIYDKINDKNKKTFENMMKNGKKADIVKLMKFAMSKVNASYEEFEEEFALDEGTKQVLAHGGKGKYKVTKDGDKIEIKFGGKVVGTADFDRGADSFFVSIKGEKGQKSFDDAQAIADYFAKNKITEEVELDEAKYELYHKDFSTAMQHAYKMAKKLHGITVDPEEIDDKVASGPRKPSEGKTNSYRLKGDKGAIQVQVYNKGGNKPYELNFYKEEVELDEVFNGTKKDIRKIARATDNALKKRSAQIQKMLKSKTNEKGRGLTDFEFDHISDEGDAIAAELVYRKKGGKDPISDDIPPHLKKFVKEEVELDEKADLKKLDTNQLEKQLGLLKIGKPTSRMKDTAKRIRDELKSRGIKAEEVVLDEWTVSDVEIAMKKKYGKIDKEAIEKLKKVQYKGNVDRNDLVKVGHGKLHIESVELGEGTILVADPKTQKVIKIDEKDWPKYEKKGYVQAEGNELDEASARADAKRAMRKDRGVDPADVDSSATDDDVKAASKNIIMQLRKSVSLRGNFPVEFMDKKKVKVDAKIASAVQDKYNSMRKADDKEKFQAKIAKSYKDMLSALKESIAEGGYVGRKDPMPAGKELAKLMKKKGKKKKESTILDRVGKKLKERKNG